MTTHHQSFYTEKYGSLALLTDRYELTMADGFLQCGIGQRETTFEMFFRKNPFKGGYTVAAGLEPVVEVLRNFRFSKEDVDYLASIDTPSGRLLFSKEFIEYLRGFKLTADIDAIPEGTVVFPQEPLIRVTGPIIECQILETILLTILNFETLIATKAARVCQATGGEPVLEFGLRRAQGIDGGMAASRASYIGGVAATSNALAGRIYGIPVKGTHAHSWVMCFDSELESFTAYAKVMPHNAVLLVDTYDTLNGVKNAIKVGLAMKAEGKKLSGIRLDSGDLAYLSQEARKMLDAAGLKETIVMASNDLDEHIIESLKQQGAAIVCWGVGTKLVTGNDQPALGGVYKLTAMRKDKEAPWEYKVKVSEQRIKITNPGRHQVRRYFNNGLYEGDAIYDLSLGMEGATILDPLDETRHKDFSKEATFKDLLVPIMRSGEIVYTCPELTEVRAHLQEELARFHGSIKRLINPHEYPVGLEQKLFHLKKELIMKARSHGQEHDR